MNLDVGTIALIDCNMIVLCWLPHSMILLLSQIIYIRNILIVASSPEPLVPTVSMAVQSYYYRINCRNIWKGSVGSLLSSVLGAQRK